MIPLPNDISPQDVHQWLNNGYFYARIDGQQRVCSYNGMVDEDSELVAAFPLDGGDSERIREVRFSAITAHWPFCGALNVGNVGVFLIRRQVRQYRRTYNPRQLQLAVPRKWDAMKLYGAAVRDLDPSNAEVVRAAFSPEYPDIQTAFEQLRSGSVFSRAINPHVVLVAAGDNLLIYYKNVYVATMGPEGKLIPVNADADTLRRLLKYFEGRASL